MKLNDRILRPRKGIHALLGACILAVCGLTPSVLQAQDLKVLVSIKPLAVLIAPLLSDKPEALSSVDVLLPANASPHNYALKVSDRKQLLEADLVVWVGLDMERFLQKPIAEIDAGKTLAAMNEGLMHWPESSDDHEHNHHGLQDPHFWLDPQNAIVLLEAVAKRLQILNPSQQRDYQRRLDNMVVKIRESELKITEILKNVQKEPFVVSHDGFGHFVARFGLNQLAAIRISVDSKPGAKHLYALRSSIVAASAHCVFVEPGEIDGWGARLAQELNLREISLDLLAVEVENMGYTEFIESLAETIEACLSEKI